MKRCGFVRIVVLLAMVCSLPCQARAGELAVSAAASLTDAFQELKPLFEKANPGVTLVFNVAASGPLFKQIEAGARMDVLATADRETMDMAIAKKLMVAESRIHFTANTLVMAVPAGSTLGLKNAKDLTSPKVERIAIGNPDWVPVGRYTRQSLTSEGVYDVLKPKLILGNSVREVLDYVTRGEVQAGFVYKTDVLIAAGKVVTVLEMGGHEPIIYSAAVVAASKQKVDASKFLAFLLTPAAQDVLAKYGFRKP